MQKETPIQPKIFNQERLRDVFTQYQQEAVDDRQRNLIEEYLLKPGCLEQISPDILDLILNAQEISKVHYLRNQDRINTLKPLRERLDHLKELDNQDPETPQEIQKISEEAQSISKIIGSVKQEEYQRLLERLTALQLQKQKLTGHQINTTSQKVALDYLTHFLDICELDAELQEAA